MSGPAPREGPSESTDGAGAMPIGDRAGADSEPATASPRLAPSPSIPWPAYRTLELCSSRGGFEAVPLREVRWDLAQVRRRLERARIPVVDARVLLIATLPPAVTIARSGRLLFKTPVAVEATAAFDRLRAVLSGASS